MGRFLPYSEEGFSVADFERTETGSPCGGLRAAVQVFQKRKGAVVAPPCSSHRLTTDLIQVIEP